MVKKFQSSASSVKRATRKAGELLGEEVCAVSSKPRCSTSRPQGWDPLSVSPRLTLCDVGEEPLLSESRLRTSRPRGVSGLGFVCEPVTRKKCRARATSPCVTVCPAPHSVAGTQPTRAAPLTGASAGLGRVTFSPPPERLFSSGSVFVWRVLGEG